MTDSVNMSTLVSSVLAFIMEYICFHVLFSIMTIIMYLFYEARTSDINTTPLRGVQD